MLSLVILNTLVSTLQDTAIILNFSIFPPCLKISNKGIITSIIHWMVWKYFSLMLFNIKTTTATTTNLLVLHCQPNVATPTTLKVQNGFSVFKLTSSDCIGIYYKDCPQFSWLKRYGVVLHNSDPCRQSWRRIPSLHKQFPVMPFKHLTQNSYK